MTNNEDILLKFVIARNTIGHQDGFVGYPMTHLKESFPSKLEISIKM